jgi:putative transposase
MWTRHWGKVIGQAVGATRASPGRCGRERNGERKTGSSGPSGGPSVGAMVSLHHRRSPHLAAFDYTSPGAYFVTVCTHERRCLFGRVQDERVLLSEAGQIVETEWLNTAARRSYVALDSHVIMPNHIHGLIIIREHAQPVRLTAAPGPRRHSLSSIVGGFKAAASRRIGHLHERHRPDLWQRGYYERVVRHEADLKSIREYIANNPSRWRQD